MSKAIGTIILLCSLHQSRVGVNRETGNSEPEEMGVRNIQKDQGQCTERLGLMSERDNEN